MLQMESKLSVSDNSGASIVKCISVNKKSRKRGGNCKDIIICSIKSIRNNKKIKRTQIAKSLIIRTKKGIMRRDGSYLKFSNNAVILLNDSKKTPVATRSFGPSVIEIKKDKSLKAVSSIINRFY